MSEISWDRAECALCHVRLGSTTEWIDHMKTIHSDFMLTHPVNWSSDPEMIIEDLRKLWFV